MITWWRIKDSQGYQLHPSPDQEKLEEEMAFKSMQDKDGGYCSKCDTVWASPGKCRCMEFEHQGPWIEYSAKNIEIKNVPVEIANDIWNAAIEAAAKSIAGAPLFANEIRKLKK